jgi:hypothetical protein
LEQIFFNQHFSGVFFQYFSEMLQHFLEMLVSSTIFCQHCKEIFVSATIFVNILRNVPTFFKNVGTFVFKIHQSAAYRAAMAARPAAAVKGSRQYGLEGGGVNRPAHKFKLFLQNDCQCPELPRLFLEPTNEATSENNHETSEIC